MKYVNKIINIWRENPRSSKDIPCTLSLQFFLREASDQLWLHTIATMRSNDAWLGVPYDTFNFNHHVVKEVDKRAYLSALAISDYIIVTCDSTSMISEAAITGKPVYIAMMKAIKNNYRFKISPYAFNQWCLIWCYI